MPDISEKTRQRKNTIVRNARAVLKYLYEGIIEHGRGSFFVNAENEVDQRALDLDVNALEAAIERLVQKRLAEDDNDHPGLRISDYGIEAMEDETGEILDRELHLPPEPELKHVHNRYARKLLAYLYKLHVDSGYKSPIADPTNAATLKAADLPDAQAFADGRARLFLHKLAAYGAPMVNNVSVGAHITDEGVRVHDSPAKLDELLEIAPPPKHAATGAHREPSPPPEVVPILAEVRDLVPVLMLDAALRAIVERDLTELEKAFTYKLHKSAAILAGSIAESLLLDVCVRNPAVSSHSTYMSGKPWPKRAMLENLIKIANTEGLIDETIRNTATQVVDHRNLVHPWLEREGKPNVNATLASQLLIFLKSVAEGLKASLDTGRVTNFIARSAPSKAQAKPSTAPPASAADAPPPAPDPLQNTDKSNT